MKKMILALGALLASGVLFATVDDPLMTSLKLKNLTATTVPYADSSKKLVSSAVTPTELGYLSGVTASLCGISQSCTLTNKTISGSSNTITNVSLTSGITGTLAVGNGGTGITSGTSGGVPYFSASNTIASSGALTANQLVLGGGAGVAPSSLAAGSQYQVLRMGATTPAYGAVSLDQSAAVSGALPVGNGGTGITSGTSGGIPYFSASNTIASSGALTANQLVIGGGAGTTPSSLAAGTQYQVLTMGASNPGYSALNLAQSAAVTGILPNANTTAASANTASAIVARDGSGNFTAGTITATLSGNASTATTATNATNVATTQVSSNASYYPLMVSSSTNGNQAADLGTGLTFNPSTNTLTTTTFSGALSGNATTATSATSATTATTATNATNVATTSTSTNATFYPLFVSSSSNGNQAADLSTGITVNPSTNTITATTVAAALSASGTSKLNSNYLSNDGGSEGITIDNSGGVTLTHASSTPQLVAAAASTTFDIYGGNRSVAPGGSNAAGGNITANGGLGTGTGASEFSVWMPLLKASGSTAQDTLHRALTVHTNSTTDSYVQVQDILKVGAASGDTGTIQMNGTTSGVVTIQPQDAAGTYNFNLPTSAGSSGQPLLSGGGGTSAQTYGTLGVAAGGTGQTSYTDGQLLIGNSTGNTLAKGTITAGSGITVTNGGGSITIASSGATPLYNYTSQTSTYSATINDWIVASGASFTITLPTAASVAGKAIVIQHAGTTETQLYTLNTTSSQTIGGVASGSYVLHTNGETLFLLSDGSNWQILNHKTITAWTSFTPTGAFTTNSTYAGYWRRVGDTMEVSFKITFSGAPNSVSSTVNIPFNSTLTIDTNKLAMTIASLLGALGTGIVQDSGVSSYACVVAYNNTTSVALGQIRASNTFANANDPVNATTPVTFGNNDTIDGYFRVPITGWQP